MNTRSIEKSIIGAILMDCDNLSIAISEGITGESFGDRTLQKIWNVMRPLAGTQFDFLIVVANCGGSPSDQEIMEIMTDVTSCVHFREWCKKLSMETARRSIKADLQAALSEIEHADIQNLIGSLTRSMYATSSGIGKRGLSSLNNLSKEACAEAQDISSGIPYFEPGSDARKKLVHKKRRIFVIAADSGMGKTEFSLGCVVLPALAEGKRVLYCCTESPAFEIYGRLASLYSRTPYRCVQQNPNQTMAPWTEGMKILNSKYKNLLHIAGSDNGIVRVSDIRRVYQSVESEYGPIDLLVIDYLQNLRAESSLSGIYEVTSSVMADIKCLTDEMGCATLVNSQLSRTSDRKKEKPNIYRLKGSGDIEHAAHAICFLYREEDSNVTSFYMGKARGIPKIDDLKLYYDTRGYYTTSHLYNQGDRP